MIFELDHPNYTPVDKVRPLIDAINTLFGMSHILNRFDIIYVNVLY